MREHSGAGKAYAVGFDGECITLIGDLKIDGTCSLIIQQGESFTVYFEVAFQLFKLIG